MGISFDCSREDSNIISLVVDRYAEIAKEQGVAVDRMSTSMDITACHCNGTPLRLADMLADETGFSLAHDVAGISNCINRSTGQLEGFFRPRYAA